MRPITIAIDGFAGGGKSTTAKRVAQNLSYTYIDTGAMYRAVTLYCLRHQIPFDTETDQLREALDHIHITFEKRGNDPIPQIKLNGEWVEQDIRKPDVSAAVSPVAVHSGTVVFPQAELKIFIHANLEVRALRRQEEMIAKGIEVPLQEIIQNLEERDHIDSTRKIAPLRKADDAIELDTTEMTIDEQVEAVCKLAHQTLKAHSA